MTPSEQAPEEFALGDVPFWPVERLCEPEPWAGHVPFAFWIVAALRPRLLVELGTHSGNSYLAFCQAVQRLGLATACFAIDTWKGDDHAGPYGEDVYRDLVRYHDPRYGAFSRLVRSTFDEAAGYFFDASVDLLHIDGLHTYDAVAADFARWQGKLSSRAVVLFHDINVRERGFGVWRLWDELAGQFPHFAFLHAHGLGVLGVGPELPDAVATLLRATRDPGLVSRIRAAFAGLGQSLVDGMRLRRLEANEEARREQTEMLRGEIERLGRAIGARDQELAARDDRIRRGADELARVAALVRGRDDEIARQLDLIETARQESRRLEEQVRAAAQELVCARARLGGKERGLAEAAAHARGLQEALELATGRIAAMESSKFWQLRRRWFRLKRMVGLDAQE